MLTSPQTIYVNARQLKEEQPGMRARDIARKLGISEGLLVASACGATSTRLNNDFIAQFTALPTLGEVMALTRSAHAVIEKIGVYNNFEHHGHASQVIGEDIDLRLFLSRFSAAFAVLEDGPRGEHRSLQYYDEYGDAVHKVHLRVDSDISAFSAFVDRFRAVDQEPGHIFAELAATPAQKPDHEIDVAGLRTAYTQMKDTHELFGILRSFSVGRLQALRLLTPEFAHPVDRLALRTLLQQAVEIELPIMIFVGSRGVIQIHTGPVHNLKQYGSWFNVMDSGFNLHLNEPGIDSAWVVQKPTADGLVSSLELYDENGDVLLLSFSKRKPGQAESEVWRKLLANLPAPSTSVQETLPSSAGGAA